MFRNIDMAKETHDHKGAFSKDCPSCMRNEKGTRSRANSQMRSSDIEHKTEKGESIEPQLKPRKERKLSK